MKSRLLIIACLLMMPCVNARAVVEILGMLEGDVYSVSKDDNPKAKEWKVNDRICFRQLSHKGAEIDYRDILACGQVLDVLEIDFLVHITSRNVKLKPGTKLKAWRPGGKTYQRTAEFAKRTLSTLPDPLDFRILSAGASYIIAPFIHVEQGLTSHLSVGFQPSYLMADVGQGKIKGFGFHFTLAYHYSELFEGPFGMVGLGALLYRGASSISLNEFRKESLSVHGSVGYRLLFLDGRVSVALSLGGQYVPGHTFAQFILGWNGFLPVGLVQAGLRF